LLAFGFVYLARDFLLPVVIAILLALVFGPAVRSMRRRGIPAPVSASAIVGVLLVGVSAGGLLLVGPVSEIVADAPRISAQIREKLYVLRAPLQAIGRATAQIEELVTPGEGTAEVVVDDGGTTAIRVIALDAGQRITSTVFCLVLLLFILASGDLFKEKLIKVLPTLHDKKNALRIANDFEHEVSRYLITVTVINIGVGIAVGLAFWALDMPSPVLWGIATALANFLPYIGAAIVAIVAFGIAVVAFDTLGQAFLPPLLFLALSAVEGQILTPMIVGRRHTLNPVVILLSVAFWGWIWGIIGALVAVPALIAIKVFADHVERLQPFGEFLSGRNGSSDARTEVVRSEAPLAQETIRR
jgi:predicted PurR-regulated permease PerM